MKHDHGLDMGIAKVSIENNGVWYINVVAPNKVYNALASKFELSILLNALGTWLDIDAPMGLGMVYINTKKCGKQIYC
jgi:hypothetical protein